MVVDDPLKRLISGGFSIGRLIDLDDIFSVTGWSPW